MEGETKDSSIAVRKIFNESKIVIVQGDSAFAKMSKM
jgi:hypothetical protein